MIEGGSGGDSEDEVNRTLLPLSWRDVAGFVLIIPASMLAAGAGLGGGPLFVPTLIIVVGFSTYYAIPISKAMIFGVSIAQLILNIRERQPLPVGRSEPYSEARTADGSFFYNLPLINFEIALLLEPLTLLGSVFGVFLNVFLPSWFTVLSICGVLLYIAGRTSVNGLKVREKEKEAELPAEVQARTRERTASLAGASEMSDLSGTGSVFDDGAYVGFNEDEIEEDWGMAQQWGKQRSRESSVEEDPEERFARRTLSTEVDVPESGRGAGGYGGRPGAHSGDAGRPGSHSGDVSEGAASSSAYLSLRDVGAAHAHWESLVGAGAGGGGGGQHSSRAGAGHHSDGSDDDLEDFHGQSAPVALRFDAPKVPPQAKLERLPIWRVVALQWHCFVVLCVVWLFVLLTSVLKGGGDDSIIGVQNCSLAYWLIVFSNIPFTLAVTGVWGYILYRRHIRLKASTGLSDADMHERGEITWDIKNVTLFPVMSVFAGVAAGMMGIGGGLIKGPLILSLGQNRNAQQSSATSAFMICFTSSSTTMQFIILQRLNISYAISYAIIGFFGSLVGKVLINRAVKKYRKTSYIIFCVVVFLSLGCYLLMVYGASAMVYSFKRGDYFVLGDLCSG